jgi:hypothetical protein
MKTSDHTLNARGRQLVNKITSLDPWIEGSFVSTSRRCGKKNCACHKGGSKHPVLYLTWKENGKTLSLYVPRRWELEVRTWVENYKKLKALIREVTLLQRQVIGLREDNECSMLVRSVSRNNEKSIPSRKKISV